MELCVIIQFSLLPPSLFYVQNMANGGLLWYFTLLYLFFQHLRIKVLKPKCPNRCFLRAAAAFTCPQNSEPISAMSCPLKDTSAFMVSL